MMRIEYMALGELTSAPRNPRRHELEQIKASIRRFGFVAVPAINETTGRIVAGHGRRDALLEMQAAGEQPPARIKVVNGVWYMPVLRGVEFATDVEAEAYLLADNRLTEIGGYDDKLLATMLAELKAQGDGALDGIGYDDDALRDLLGEPAPSGGNTDPDAIPDPPTEPITKRGDIWILGEHRILCGDSTNTEDVSRLMDGKRAAMMATDPPYLVDYTGENHPQSFARQKAHKTNNKNWDAYKDPESSSAFFADFIRVALANALVENPAIYQWHASRRQALVEAAWKENGLLVHQQLIWVKSRPILTRSHFMWQHEPCFYGWIEGRPPALRPPCGGECTSVWQIAQGGEDVKERGDEDVEHPTQKPVEISQRPISYHTRPGDIVYEPFSGSGSQIIAAERLGRRCFAMEISPEFVDVDVARWEGFTGRKAYRAGQDPPVEAEPGASLSIVAPDKLPF